ncbi:MAG: hypothetical protein HY725_22340 [Candidatus Rokubacteria bacterium]|nr:hypothetical protein [Candidatus Rokubacteria bacterium]
MTQPNWQPLAKDPYKVPAKPKGLWTKVCDYVEGPVKLKLEADGEWEYSKKRCGPDGAPQEGLVTDTLVPSAPLGALVGKIGGSSADKPDVSKVLVFAVGSYCVVSLDNTARGALFLTMNDVVGRFDEHDGEVSVTISEAR